LTDDELSVVSGDWPVYPAWHWHA